MKKIALGIVGLVVAVSVYYMAFGSVQATEELKVVVDRELKTLQKQGFAIQNREIKEESEHFEVVFDDTTTIAKYLNEQGAAITAEEAASLKGMKFGIDLTYLKDSYSAISMDLYPTSLPDSITKGELSKEDKKALAKIDELFAAKTFLVQVDINKMLNGFKGSMKDIDETFGDAGEQVVMKMEAMQFHGDIKDERVTAINQTLQSFLLKAEDELDLQVSGIKSRYLFDGPTRYDTTADYSIEKITYSEKSKLYMIIEKLKADTKTSMKNDLAHSTVNSNIGSIEVTDRGKLNKITGLALDMKVANLDIKAFEQLQQIDTMDQSQIDKVTQQILSQGLSLEIAKFSIEKLYMQNRDIDGFAMDAKLDIDKNLNLSALQANPMLGLTAVKAHLNLKFSEALHTFISQQPQALLAMMMFQPKDQNGKKVYEIKLEDGSLSVNGVAMQ